MHEVRPFTVGFFARKWLRMTKILSVAPLPRNDNRAMRRKRTRRNIAAEIYKARKKSPHFTVVPIGN